MSFADARARVEEWCSGDNQLSPHTAIGNRVPSSLIDEPTAPSALSAPLWLDHCRHATRHWIAPAGRGVVKAQGWYVDYLWRHHWGIKSN
jgi:hypothetical protein